MALGAGRYDAECTVARESAAAMCAIVIIFGGDRGDGFSCQADLETLAKLPSLLRHMADSMEKDMRGGNGDD